MKLTLQVQLQPNAKDAELLRRTLECFNEACDWLAGEAFKLRLANKVRLQQLFYRRLREEFGLPAQPAVRCIGRVVIAYRRDVEKRVRFRKHGAVPYDERMMSFRGGDRVSLSTLQGRAVVPLVMGEYQRERLPRAKGQSHLVLRRDGKWFLHVTLDVPEGAPIPGSDFIGVDLGVTNIASTSDGESFCGEEVERVRRRHSSRLLSLQKAAARRSAEGRRPRAIRRAMKRLRGRTANMRRHTNHCVSKRLVALATGTARGLALEDLTHIRDRTRFRRGQRDRMNGWAFAQLRAFISYKAKLSGVRLVLVDPRDTSRTCSVCGHCERANRKSQDKFKCLRCGHAAHADVNAARNIRARAYVSVPQFSGRSRHTAA